MAKSTFQPHGPGALSYWKLFKNNFAKIAPIISYISKMPASSSSLERIFSEISRKGWVPARFNRKIFFSLFKCSARQPYHKLVKTDVHFFAKHLLLSNKVRTNLDDLSRKSSNSNKYSLFKHEP